MYAILQNGNKQYQACQGQTIRMEKINAQIGETIKFNQILLVSNNQEIKIGNPLISNCIIEAKVVSHVRGKKSKVLKFNRRKHYRKKYGHRQYFTDLKIMNILYN